MAIVKERVRISRGRISTDTKKWIRGRFGDKLGSHLRSTYHTDADGRKYCTPTWYGLVRSVAILNEKDGRLTVSDVAMLDLAAKAAIEQRVLREGLAGRDDFSKVCGLFVFALFWPFSLLLVCIRSLLTPSIAFIPCARAGVEGGICVHWRPPGG